MDGLMNTRVMVQVGYIVRDIEATKRKYAEFFGVDVPETVDGTEGPAKFSVTQTTYKGKKNPEINAKLAFFEVGGVMAIELIEPNETPSLWRDWLEEHGEGIQHIAFVVDSIDETIPRCEAFGMNVLQTGNFAAGDGRYAYMDATKDLKTIIELLERWK
jgi:catechol 2,3-dioxygenase-like lactoylglutathione lyase family enzyme